MGLPTDSVLQQIYRLDRSSPDFRSQLDNALHRREYHQRAQELNEDDLMWLVNYLDGVRCHITSSHTYSTKHRFSVPLISPVLLPESVFAN